MMPSSPLPWGNYPPPELYDAPTAHYMPRPATTLPRPSQPVMYGYAPRYPTRTAARLRVGLGVLVALLTVPLIAWGAFVARRETKNMVLFTNEGAEGVDLVVDGAPRGKIPAHASVALDFTPGEHKVVAGSDRGSFSVPARKEYEPGARGLYVIGPRPRLAVVTKYYAVGRAPFDDKVVPIADGARFTELPDTMSVDALAVDRAFPDAISVPQGTRYTTVTRVCHLTRRGAGTGTVGCAGY